MRPLRDRSARQQANALLETALTAISRQATQFQHPNFHLLRSYVRDKFVAIAWSALEEITPEKLKACNALQLAIIAQRCMQACAEPDQPRALQGHLTLIQQHIGLVRSHAVSEATVPAIEAEKVG